MIQNESYGRFGNLLLKKKWISDPSKTTLKPSGEFQTGFRPLWNQHWTPRDGLGEAVYRKQVVGTDLRQFPAAVWFKTNHTAVSEPSFKKKVNFRVVWNQSETIRSVSDWFQTSLQGLERPYVAKQLVSTDSGTPKSQKTLSFWHSTAGFP